MRSRLITGVTGDQPFPSCVLRSVRIAGTANTLGAIQIKRGSTVLETIPAGSAPGAARDYGKGKAGGTKFDANTGILNINMANAGDSVLAFLD